MYTDCGVITLNDLVEKIRIFDDGHDDRVIEIAKLVIQRQDPEFTEGSLLYDEVEEAEGDEATIRFVHLEEAGWQTVDQGFAENLLAQIGSDE